MNQPKSKSPAPKVVIAPLPLDQIMSHVNQFGINLDSLEHKISENKGLGLKMEQLTTQNAAYREKMRSQATGHTNSNQFASGVQGGVDSQSLETILEFKDGMFGIDTSRGYSHY